MTRTGDPGGGIDFAFEPGGAAAPGGSAVRDAKALRALWTGILATASAVGLLTVAASLPKQGDYVVAGGGVRSVCRLDLGPYDAAEAWLPIGRAGADQAARSCALTDAYRSRLLVN